MIRGAKAWAAGLFVAGVTLGSAPAWAELFRCAGPDGKMIYTDQKALCPGAEAHEPSGVVHNTPSAPKRTAPAARRRAPLVDESQAPIWRQKRLDAETAIEQIRVHREKLRPHVSHCNRGGYVTTRDDAGIKRRVSCSWLRSEFAKLDDQEAEARAYLDGGLRDECRRAGCLPGWIR